MRMDLWLLLALDVVLRSISCSPFAQADHVFPRLPEHARGGPFFPLHGCNSCIRVFVQKLLRDSHIEHPSVTQCSWTCRCVISLAAWDEQPSPIAAPRMHEVRIESG
eukprot:6197429-Pleurochrysis_carterae.AAC.1